MNKRAWFFVFAAILAVFLTTLAHDFVADRFGLAKPEWVFWKDSVRQDTVAPSPSPYRIQAEYPGIIQAGDFIQFVWTTGPKWATSCRFGKWLTEELDNNGATTLYSPVNSGVFTDDFTCTWADGKAMSINISIEVVEPITFTTDSWGVENGIVIAAHGGKIVEVLTDNVTDPAICEWKNQFDEPYRHISIIGYDTVGLVDVYVYDFIDSVANLMHPMDPNRKIEVLRTDIFKISNGIFEGSASVTVCTDGLRFKTNPESQ